MRVSDGHNRSIVPLRDFIQQAHQTRVGDQRANLRFWDVHEVKVIVRTFASLRSE